MLSTQPNLPAFASLRHGDSHLAIQLAEAHRLWSPGPSFYLVRDWPTQCFRLCKQEELRAIAGLTTPHRMTYAQYTNMICAEDQEGFFVMERRWRKLIASQPAALLPHYKINFDYRIKTHNQETVRLLHQIVHLALDESGVVRHSVERCTDISVWKRYGAMVLSVIGPAPSTPYYFRPDGLPGGEVHSSLTKTEKKVVQLLISGKSSKEIASQLDITFNTANTHRRNILRKAEAKNTVELVKYALQHE